MQKILKILFVLGILMVGTTGYAAALSDSKTDLEYRAVKVWRSGNDLCISGVLTNLRNDRVVTKLVSFTPNITLTRHDGSKYQVSRTVNKLPLCRINAKSDKTITINLGAFNDEWATWYAEADYVYQYNEQF